jgi:hypothetical protein
MYNTSQLHLSNFCSELVHVLVDEPIDRSQKKFQKKLN